MDIKYLDDSLKTVLNHYFNVLDGSELSYSHKASIISAKNHKNLPDNWREHERIRMSFPMVDSYSLTSEIKKPSSSYLDLKISIAEQLFQNCIFCHRRCEIDRNLETGFCGVKKSKIASEFLHIGEERPIIPSHTVFFTGCSFKCLYCQNWDISQYPTEGLEYSAQKIAEIIDRRKLEGSCNVNFVGGDPNPHLLFIFKVIRLIKENLPVIWNSNFYMTPEAMALLDGVVDLYLSDFKYGNDKCAMRLSGASDYWKVVTGNHRLAWESGDMIIRHLVLPNHVECCTIPLLDWIYENLGENPVINIMAQYRPVYNAKNHAEISGFPDHQEYAKAVDYARDLGFKNLI